MNNKQRLKTALLWLLFIGMGIPTAHAQGWPASYGGVMLQGFYWDSYNETRWEDLTNQSDELSKYFSLIWVPNSGMTSNYYWDSNSTSMGYDPCFWLNHNSCWGTEQQLRTMINTFKNKGTGIIEDVVINHKNGVSEWRDFPDESRDGYSITWDNVNYTAICSNDEANYNGYPTGGAPDTGDNFDGYRDLDHTNATVQQNVITYLLFLLDELGYAGFRYDMVKGYSPYYTKIYNEAVQPEFSVGEYWDNKNAIYNWVNGTEMKSAAFDFGLKFVINSAFGSTNWDALQDKGMAADINGYSRYSVTFVDNHDTYRDMNRLASNVLAANAFILAMPGTPCIFWPHWKAYKNELKRMIKARQAAGVTNTSSIIEQYPYGGGYIIKTHGTVGDVLMICGYVSDFETTGFKAVSTGTAQNPNYAYFVSNNVNLGYMDAQPMMSEEPGDYYPSVTTTLSSSMSGATIVYTTDGSEPTVNTPTRTTTSATFTFNTNTTVKAGILIDEDVMNVKEFTYRVMQDPERFYARSTTGRRMYFYTYSPEINGIWGSANLITHTEVIKGETWYYCDYDLQTYPNLRMIVRDSIDNGNRYPVSGEGFLLKDKVNTPYFLLDGNNLTAYSLEDMDQWGVYYLVSDQLTGGQKLEEFKFNDVRRRDNNQIDSHLFSFTLKDNQLSGTTYYYIAGKDNNGKEVEYRPWTANYGIAMNSNDNNYNDQNNVNRPTTDYQSYDNCKWNVGERNNLFSLTKGRGKSYTWTLNTTGNGNVGTTAFWSGQDKWQGMPYGKYSVALQLNKSINDDSNGFYLFGNLVWSDSENNWVWTSSNDEKYKFTREESITDSLIYYIDISNEGHPFKDLYLVIAPGSLFNGSWTDDKWDKVIRVTAPADRNAVALSGGLYIPAENNQLNKDQTFNPEIDEDVMDSYRLYINLTSATYGAIFKTSPYLIGTAVGVDFAQTEQAIPLEWDDEEECYKYTGEFTQGGEMRIVANQSYKLNWSEDGNPAGTSTDGDYNNHLVYNGNDTGNETECSGDRITFNPESGTYTLRFYNSEHPYYTLSRPLQLRNMTCISNNEGERLGEIDALTRTIDGTTYKSATSWADNVAYEKPEGVDIYIVTGVEKSESGEVYKATLKKLNIDYIPASTGVLLFSENAPQTETDRFLTLEMKGCENATLSYTGNDNLLRAIVTPLFIPGTVTDGSNNVSYRNFMFGYYRVKPYATGTTEKGYYDYKLGFWRSKTTEDDNPSANLSSPHMAYLQLTPSEYGDNEYGMFDGAVTDPSDAPYIHFTFEDADPLGITNAVVPMTDHGYYTLQGIRVNKPNGKGIYIHQGKKIIIK